MNKNISVILGTLSLILAGNSFATEMVNCNGAQVYLTFSNSGRTVEISGQAKGEFIVDSTQALDNWKTYSGHDLTGKIAWINQNAKLNVTDSLIDPKLSSPRKGSIQLDGTAYSCFEVEITQPAVSAGNTAIIGHSFVSSSDVHEADATAIDNVLSSWGPPKIIRDGKIHSETKLNTLAGDVWYGVKTNDGNCWTFRVHNDIKPDGSVTATVAEEENAIASGCPERD